MAEETKKSKKIGFKNLIMGERSLLATVLLIILVIASLVSAYLGCTRIVYDHAYKQLEDAANTVNDQVHSKFQRDKEVLDATAEIIADSHAFDSEDIGADEFSKELADYIKNVAPIQNMMNLRIYTASGDVFLPDEGLSETFKIPKEAYDQLVPLVEATGDFISSREVSKRTGMEGKQIVQQYVPVRHGDKIVALLCGVTVLSRLPQLLRVNNIYNGNANVAIVDRLSVNDSGDPAKKYEMIMDTVQTGMDGAKELGYFTDYLDLKIRGFKSVEAFQADVVGKGTGDAQIWSAEEKEWMYLYYTPVGGSATRWSVIISVPKSVVFSNVKNVQIVFVVIGSVVAVALVLYFFLIRRNAKAAIEKSVERAVLEEKLIKAEAAERAKTAFLSNMSHDIRTPMNAILGFTALAETNINDKKKVQDYLAKILSSGNHLLSLINDILDMSRIESGKLNIEEKPCSISDIFRDLRNIIQTQMKSKQLNFFMDTLDVTDEEIYCDKLHVNQILLNLLSNAIKFTPAGGSISLTIRQKAGAPTGYGAYELRVKDTGIGMSEEFAVHIFEPFERERTSTVSGIQGTGLGMAITKSIVDAMGGTIELVTEKEKGTEFIVNLQFRLQTEEVRPAAIQELAGLRALVVDDNFDTCDSVSKMLLKIGMHAEWTMHGNEAVLRAKQAVETGEGFAVYIIDWVMPDLSGFEIVRQIRKIVGEDIPIIIITAYDVAAIMDEAQDIGVTAYCNKPVFLSELRDTLLSVIEARAGKAPEALPAPDTSAFQGKRILLVEDNALNREIAEELLQENGFEVDTAEDGSVAVEKVKAAEAGYYDLVLMDVQMPVMNGYEATKSIRALEGERAEVPIIAMTANAFDEDRKKAAECGMNAHVAKPINIPQLFEVLRKILLGEAE